MFNNSCESDTQPGLIHMLSTLTLSSCFFQLHTDDYFLGTSSSSAVNVTFIDCDDEEKVRKKREERRKNKK
jgi:hypothetical protein